MVSYGKVVVFRVLAFLLVQVCVCDKRHSCRRFLGLEQADERALAEPEDEELIVCGEIFLPRSTGFETPDDAPRQDRAIQVLIIE